MTLRARRWWKSEFLFFFLLVLVLVLSTLNVAKAMGLLIPEPSGIPVRDGTIQLSDLTLEHKIAQMVIVSGSSHNLDAWKRMQLGGVHFFAMQDASLFREKIAQYQEGQTVPFFVTADLEGCLNPFAAFQVFPAASEITTVEEAYQKGKEEGIFLWELGFSVNFAPVVDLQDSIWKCRSFPGNEIEVTAKADAYVRGLQEGGIIATIKHYPGKTLVVRDPHKYLVAAVIEDKDVYPYGVLAENTRGVMISHIITSGEVDSGGIPAVASPAVVEELAQRFRGLVITDEINMLGLRGFYPTLDEMYVAVFAAGNDLILNFNEDPNEIYRMITVVKGAVERGEISESQINASVRKILSAKGFTVIG